MDSLSSPPADPSSQSSVAPAAATTTPPSSAFDPAKVKRYVSQLRDRQNLGLGLLGGAIGAAVGAAGWGLLTALFKWQIGWEAIGVGFLTGYGVRKLGKGIDPIFGYVGAVLSLLGCALGNILAVMIFVSQRDNIPFTDMLARLTPNIAWQLLVADFQPIDALFYGLGLYYGYRNSFHRITKDELATFVS